MSRFAPIFSAAACLIVVGGVSGVLYSLNNVKDDKNAGSSSMTNITSTLPDNSLEANPIDHESTSINENKTEKDNSTNSETNDYDAPVTTTTVTAVIDPSDENNVITEQQLDNSNNSQTDMSLYLDIANDLINDLNSLYFMGIGGGVSYDLSQEPYYVYDPDIPYCEEEGKVRYDYVSDDNFRSTEDIRNFINNTVTEKFTDDPAHPWINSILDPECPMFVDYNGSLYGLKWLASHSGGRGYAGYTATKIKDMSDTSFTAYVTADPAADSDDHFEMKVVKENGTWKVDEGQ